MEYKIKEIKDNTKVDRDNPSYCTFDVLVEYDGKTKWISVQHTDYFVWAMLDSKSLESYIENKNFKNWDDTIEDLSELNYDWDKEMIRYLEKFYPKRVFMILPEYDADSFDIFDFDEDDF